MSVRRGEVIKRNGEQVGHVMKVRIVKNKIAVPFKEATINLVYGEGIDRADELFQISVKAGFIRQGGAWYTYIDQDTGEIMEYNDVEIRTQGKDKMIDLIREIPELFIDLENKIRGVKVEADDMPEDEIAVIENEKE